MYLYWGSMLENGRESHCNAFSGKFSKIRDFFNLKSEQVCLKNIIAIIEKFEVLRIFQAMLSMKSNVNNHTFCLYPFGRTAV